MIEYSPSEKKMLSLLSAKPQNTPVLCDKFFKGEERPYHDRHVVVGVVSSLAKKAKLNKEPFVVHKSKRAGPRPISFWIEKL